MTLQVVENIARRAASNHLRMMGQEADPALFDVDIDKLEESPHQAGRWTFHVAVSNFDWNVWVEGVKYDDCSFCIELSVSAWPNL
jgi:hypothetical protein